MSAIGRAGAEQGEALAALHATAFARGWTAGEIDALLADPSILCLMAGNGLPEGFIMARHAADEAEIITLAVAAASRRRGIARKLIGEAVTRLVALGIRQLFLEVAADNAPARALYDSCGFRQVGRRPGYYGGASRADALTLARHLVMIDDGGPQAA